LIPITKNYSFLEPVMLELEKKLEQWLYNLMHVCLNKKVDQVVVTSRTGRETIQGTARSTTGADGIISSTKRPMTATNLHHHLMKDPRSALASARQSSRREELRSGTPGMSARLRSQRDRIEEIDELMN
jgi:hypothetical protein